MVIFFSWIDPNMGILYQQVQASGKDSTVIIIIIKNLPCPFITSRIADLALFFIFFHQMPFHIVF